MTHRGRTTVHLNLPAARDVSIACDDLIRSTYVDFYRPDVQRGARRLLNPGDREMVSLAPGPIEIALGESAVLEDYA